MKNLSIVIFFFLSVTGANATQTQICKFEKECLGVDGCNDTTFELTATIDGEKGEFSSDLGTQSATVTRSEDGKVIGLMSSAVFGDHQLLTIFGDVARYSIHMPTSELGIYYTGKCTVK